MFDSVLAVVPALLLVSELVCISVLDPDNVVSPIVMLVAAVVA